MVAEGFTIRSMVEEDISFGLELGEHSGWNQLPADWLRIYRYQPAGCFVATFNDRPIGTITTTCYGTELAWIGMMLVHPEFRRRGYATALMQHAINWLHVKGIECIKLDATPEGAKVYEQLGFQQEWDFERWMRPAQTDSSSNLQRSNLEVDHLAKLDLEAFGVDRAAWLQTLAADSTVEVQKNGFGMLRRGRLADYLGPVISENSQTANLIIKNLLSQTDRPLFWDIPGPNMPAQQFATQFSFSKSRSLTRMWLGSRLIQGAPELQYALASPATG